MIWYNWLIVTLFVVAKVASEVTSVNDRNFREVVLDSGKYTLVDFYADWCRHCQKLAPAYEKVAELFEKVPEVQVVKINGDKDGKGTVKKYDIPGFPFIYMFHGDDEPVEFDGGRDAESIANFVQQLSGVRLKVDSEKTKSSNLEELHDLNFEEKVLTKTSATLVLFTKNSCTRCYEYESWFLELADLLFAGDNETILFGQVQMDESPAREIMNQFGVGMVPSVMYFDPNGVSEDGLKRPELYDGKRSLSGLVNFVNRMAGLHRSDSGSLLPSAGRVSKIDQLVQEKLQLVKKLTEEDGIELLTAIGELSLVIQDSTNKYHQDVLRPHDDPSMIPYYKKLVNKIINGEDDFFDVELKRLHTILAGTSNMKKSTADHMQKRVNILERFVR